MAPATGINNKTIESEQRTANSEQRQRSAATSRQQRSPLGEPSTISQVNPYQPLVHYSCDAVARFQTPAASVHSRSSISGKTNLPLLISMVFLSGCRGVQEKWSASTGARGCTSSTGCSHEAIHQLGKLELKHNACCYA
jgi:hypothetical protein